ncbi:Chemotaxis protein CheC -- inhibitor of MCP methylation [Citrifermentans bremense]|uniref:Chemotaxis protein CheC n=2 Tax=Geobacteraceae TaxID=213422 RepID=A0ABQ0MKV7_9BACT|nr:MULTISPECIES: chemotaxis protein CheC [Geobacteraceae]BCG45877.1 Chemotaxis protein CheC -- inhibitor of MCP methylation [Citrifermentans bremense]GAW67674.1 chemotaxis protein CheC [Geoanaerobacter pelophilus]
MPNPALQQAELAALTEVCKIGMEHAATALSQLMGKGVSIEVPRLKFVDNAKFAGLIEGQEVTALHLQILGNVRGSILILLPHKNALRVVELLLGTAPKPGAPLSELERATLMEVGNILASACLNALGNTLKMTLLPSVPTLMSGSGEALFARIKEQGGESESIVMIDTMFSVSDAFCGGSIFLVPATSSLEAMLAALEKQ